VWVGQTLRVWDIAQKRLFKTVHAHEPCVSSLGRRSRGPSQQLSFLHGTHGTVRMLPAATNPKGSHVATGGVDLKVKVWECS
jgi:WD40 repeat protein